MLPRAPDSAPQRPGRPTLEVQLLSGHESTDWELPDHTSDSKGLQSSLGGQYLFDIERDILDYPRCCHTHSSYQAVSIDSCSLLQLKEGTAIVNDVASCGLHVYDDTMSVHHVNSLQ